MKNYKQILEAVNRGIQLALDDFDDEEQVQNIKSKQVQNRDYTKEYLDLMDDVVDFELPSGTLWCKYNLDVNPNKLSKAKDWYGKYYAWGELKPNKINERGEIYFSWGNYKFGEGHDKLTKYCNNPEYGLNEFTDNLTQILPEDDAAYQNKKFYNYKFHIPTKEQFEELINYTDNYWVNNYDPSKIEHNLEDDGGIKGLNGTIFEGNNGVQMFIPATGFYNCSDERWNGTGCCSWSSSLGLRQDTAYYLNFNSINIRLFTVDRYYGFTIRPVINL